MTRKFQINRRHFIGAGASALAMPAIWRPGRAFAAGRPIKIGLVSPQTGPLAAFAEADQFVLDGIRKTTGGMLDRGGEKVAIEIIVKDSQSNPNRAAEVAADLILSDEVDLIMAASTPDTTNPVADQAEINEVPCITTDCPWQPYFFGRNGDPKTGFDWTYHFFWGLEDVIAAFLDLWNGSGVEKRIGGLFPNDADGNAWADPVFGFPPALKEAGYTLTDPGRYQPLSDDFTAQISAFKEADCQIITGNMIPPDFATFWSQAAQQGFQPKVVTVGKALLFPSVIDSLGARGDGLSSEIWWSPHHPFSSSLTNQTAGELCAAYTDGTGRPWTQPIGFKHALFEVAFDVLKRSEDTSPDAILEAITSTDLATIVGPVNWSGQPVRNVSKTPLVAGQWRKDGDKADLVITTNETAPEIPTGGKLKLLS
ncbi:branched-chain amino acid transport system substrate-binding protein [Amorphus suaedae]